MVTRADKFPVFGHQAVEPARAIARAPDITAEAEHSSECEVADPMTKAEEAQHAEALHGLMLSTTATNKAIAMLAEVQMARLAHPDIPRSEKSPIDRLWAAAPVVLICATMLISTNSRFLTGESSLDKRVGFIERDEIDHKERERIRERDIKLLDSYNRDLVNFLRERGIKNAPAPPTLGKEDR